MTTLPNEEFLNRTFIEQKVMEIANPMLDYASVLPMVKADSKSVKFLKETTSASTDTKKKTPRRLGETGGWTYVEFTELEADSAILNKSGYAMKVTRDAQRFTEGIDEIKRGLDRIIFWTTEDINSKIASKLQAAATGPTTHLGSPTAWSAAGATPLLDILHMKRDMKQVGYPYRMTDLYLYEDNFGELIENLITHDAKYSWGDKITDVTAKTLTMPAIANVTLHEVDSGVADSAVMGLDRNNPAGTFYYNLDPKYSSDNLEGLYFNVNVFENEGGETTEVRIWADWDVAVKEPKACIYAASKI